MKQTTHRKHPKGFTLIGLMVSVAITVILLGILFNITATSADSLESAKNKVEMGRPAETLSNQIETDISSMIVRNNQNEWFYVGSPITTYCGNTGSPLINPPQI